MSFKGGIEAQCPGGCEPFDAEIWSYIRGDQSVELRDAVVARECNLLLCPGCNKAFFPEAPYVYFDPTADILAFVFPESYRDKEPYWREKMNADFAVFKQNLGAVLSFDVVPALFFGPEGLGALLDDEDWRRDELDVMEFIAKDLGLSIYRVRPVFARENKVPGSLPYTGKKATRESVLAGLEKIVAANDRLTVFADYLKVLKAGGELPPAAPLRS
jgi:hypothetical protein